MEPLGWSSQWNKWLFRDCTDRRGLSAVDLMVTKVGWSVSSSSMLASSKSSNLDSLFDLFWLISFNFLLAVDGVAYFGLSLRKDFSKFFSSTCRWIKIEFASTRED